MVDRNLLLRKLANLEEYTGQVSEYEKISLAEYRGDWKTQRAVERTLQMMIETCCDIAAHIIADRRLRTPESYADSFLVLAEGGVLPMNLSTLMQKMAKFRNVVVHQYEKVDAEIVLLILHRHLVDFQHFAEAVISHLKADGSSAKE